jgi:polysaccharide export outer membrane protein
MIHLGMAALAAVSAFAQEGPRATAVPDTVNLPVQEIGKDDLLGVQVYDSPELTRNVRVGADGTIRLPMLKNTIKVEGLLPVAVESLLASQIKKEEILVDPFVTVTIMEYHSRPINVTGAVKNPTVFQAVGRVTLLDAIAKAGGLDMNAPAGGEIVITRPNGESGVQSIQRIPVKQLIDGADPQLNVLLVGGEEVRVPVASTVVVTGNVMQSGVYPVQENGTTTVLTALAQAHGVGQYVPDKVYIYRFDDQGARHEIEVDLKAIRARKKPDVVLQAKDMLYIPDNNKSKWTQQAIQSVTGVAGSASTALIYTRGR